MPLQWILLNMLCGYLLVSFFWCFSYVSFWQIVSFSMQTHTLFICLELLALKGGVWVHVTVSKCPPLLINNS